MMKKAFPREVHVNNAKEKGLNQYSVDQIR